jgi:hypothetical protein
MEYGRWWLGDVLATACGCYSIGFIHDSFIESIVFSVILEFIAVIVSVNSAYGFTFAIAVLASILGSSDICGFGLRRRSNNGNNNKSEHRHGAHEHHTNEKTQTKKSYSVSTIDSEDHRNEERDDDDENGFGRGYIRIMSTERKVLLMVVESIIYVVCRAVSGETTFDGYPCGIFLSMAILSIYYFCITEIFDINSSNKIIGGQEERLKIPEWFRNVLCLAFSIYTVHILVVLSNFVTPEWLISSDLSTKSRLECILSYALAFLTVGIIPLSAYFFDIFLFKSL